MPLPAGGLCTWGAVVSGAVVSAGLGFSAGWSGVSVGGVILELQSLLASSIGQSLDVTVILKSSAIENHGLHSLFDGALCYKLADTPSDSDRGPLGI